MKHSRTKKSLKKHKKSLKKHIFLQDDYYNSINKSWINDSSVPKTSTMHNNFTILTHRVSIDLKNLILKKLWNKNTPSSIQCKNLYLSSMQYNNALVEKKMYLYIHDINEYRKNPVNMYKFLAWGSLNGFKSPIRFGLSNNYNNPTHYIGSISPSGTTFADKKVYLNTDKQYVVLRNSYTMFVQNVFMLFFGQNNCYSANDVLEVETILATYFQTPAEMHDIFKITHPMSLNSINKKLNFNAKMYLSLLKITNVSTLDIINPLYIKKVLPILSKNWSSNKWNSYWVFTLLSQFSNYHSVLSAYYFFFFSQQLTGISKSVPRSIKSTYLVASIMNSTMSEMYLQYYKNTQAINYVSNLAAVLKNVLKQRLETNTWMHTSTKTHALEKLSAMRFSIGEKNGFLPDIQCFFQPDDIIGNIISYNHWVMNRIKTQIDKRIPDKKYWLPSEESNVFDVNAFYNDAENEMIIPNAILQPPFVNLQKNFVYNLSHIGFVISHEMIHGFDKNGREFDKNGKLSNWWNHKDETRYENMQANIKKLYSELNKKDGVKEDTDLTLSENIADLSALQILEQTLNLYLNNLNIVNQEKRNKYFEDLYINYARSWRNILRNDSKKDMFPGDHSSNKYRVNAVLMHSHHFQHLYHLQPGNGMYYNNSTEQIW